jgi:hypothetical protein
MARKKRSRPVEYDLHGLRGEQVAVRLDTILRRHKGSAATVHIVHGKSGAVLAAEVERVARSDPRVADCYRSGLNPGMTVLQLDPRASDPPPPSTQQPRVWDDYREPPHRGSKHRGR